MCSVPALAIASTAVSAIGSVYGGLVANAQSKYQQRVAEANAAIERENIRLEQERGAREALLLYRKVAQLKGEQRAAAAANGVSTDFGTAQDIVTDTDLLAREDIANIYGQTFQNVRGMDRSVSNYIAEGRAARAAGKGALIGSFFEAGKTILGGARQYKELKDQGYTLSGKGKAASKAMKTFGTS
jgi:hypothetical protein